MEELMDYVANAIKAKANTNQIHDELIKKGCSEGDIFLAIKSGELLYKHRQEQAEEKANRKPPFGRK